MKTSDFLWDIAGWAAKIFMCILMGVIFLCSFVILSPLILIHELLNIKS